MAALKGGVSPPGLLLPTSDLQGGPPFLVNRTALRPSSRACPCWPRAPALDARALWAAGPAHVLGRKLVQALLGDRGSRHSSFFES